MVGKNARLNDPALKGLEKRSALRIIRERRRIRP